MSNVESMLSLPSTVQLKIAINPTITLTSCLYSQRTICK